MPKILSLKKQSQTVTSKNQKPITQFFRCDQSKLKGSHVENGSQESQEINLKSCKRKAESPPKLKETCEDVDIESGSTIKLIDTIGNISKKLKSEPMEGTLNNSYREDPNLTFMESQLKNINELDNKQLIEDKKEQRIPLSPLSVDNHNSTKIDESSPHSKFENKSRQKQNGIDNQNTTPEKCYGNIKSPSPKKIRTPKDLKSASKTQSPWKISFHTPEKVNDSNIECSPSKFGSTVKMMTFGQDDVEDVFGDDWDFNHENDLIEDLDLTTIQRCEVLSVKKYTNKLELRLKNDNQNVGTCYIEGIWMNTPLQDGEILSIMASKNASGQFAVTNTSGLLSLRPDHLISSTSVVAGVFCKRKAVLQERFRGIDAANTAMTIGILIHELVQRALTRHITSAAVLKSEADNILKHSTQMLYDAGLTAEEARSNIQTYIVPLADFMHLYVGKNPSSVVGILSVCCILFIALLKYLYL